MKKSVIVLQIGRLAFQVVSKEMANAKFREGSVVRVIKDADDALRLVSPEEKQFLILDAIPGAEGEARTLIYQVRGKNPSIRTALFTADLEDLDASFLNYVDTVIHYHEGVAGFAHNLIVAIRRFLMEG